MAKEHKSSTLKKVIKKLKKEGFIFEDKKRGAFIRHPKGGPSYMMHFAEEAIHPMRRFFKRNYNINILE